MIATEILKGQGLGNQLFCYVTTRAIAKKRDLEFGIKDSSGWMGDKRYNQSGIYWMDIHMGNEVPDNLSVYEEKCLRKKTNTCHHDMVTGCDVRGYDSDLVNVPDNSMIYGIMQDEKYFIEFKEDIKSWLKIKKEYDTYELTRDDVCILNFRGGEYVGFHELYLTRNYWINAINNMLNINPNMKFVSITDDVNSSKQLLPEIPAYHFDVGKDYVIIKNAKHVILSNSSFAFFPVFTSDTIETIIAPKYWARHNVSDGYWSTNQNIYSGWTYQDRDGNLYTKDECLSEL